MLEIIFKITPTDLIQYSPQLPLPVGEGAGHKLFKLEAMEDQAVEAVLMEVVHPLLEVETPPQPPHLKEIMEELLVV
jgi:hypothetical protein